MPRPIPNARWILGRGWNQELWPDKRFPTAADLDAVVSDRPVWLERVDGHAAVANSAAMQAAGFSLNTEVPAGRTDRKRPVRRCRDESGGIENPGTASGAICDAALAKAQELMLASRPHRRRRHGDQRLTIGRR